MPNCKQTGNSSFEVMQDSEIISSILCGDVSPKPHSDIAPDPGSSLPAPAGNFSPKTRGARDRRDAAQWLYPGRFVAGCGGGLVAGRTTLYCFPTNRN